MKPDLRLNRNELDLEQTMMTHLSLLGVQVFETLPLVTFRLEDSANRKRAFSVDAIALHA